MEDYDYKNIILQLIPNVGKSEDTIDFVIKSKSLKEAIERAFYSENEKGKLNSHQYRAGRNTLNRAKEKFFKNNLNKQLVNCENFECILNIIKDAKIFKFGKLAIYDVSLRIALYLNNAKQTDKFTSKYVYLYGQGPRKSYKKIFNKQIKKNRINPNDLINNEIEDIIIKSNLTTWQIEFLLCDFARKLNL